MASLLLSSVIATPAPPPPWASPVPDGLAVEGNRLITTRQFAAGEQVLFIARQATLSKDSAQVTALLQFLDPTDGKLPRGMMHWAKQPDAVVIALLVSQLDALLPKANHAAWTSWLSHATHLNGTTDWSADELEPLEATHCHTRSGEHVKRLDQQLSSVLDPLQAHEPFRALFGRGFGAKRMEGIAQTVAAHALRPAPSFEPLLLPLPFLRQAYHGACSVAESEDDGDEGGGEGGGGEGGGVELIALRDLGAGEEITIDAHGYDVATLMIRQGDPGIPPRGVAAPPRQRATSSAAALAAAAATSVRLSVSVEVGDGPLGALKQLVLGKASLRAEEQAFTLKGGVPPEYEGGPGFRAPLPPKLMPYARLAVLQEHEESLLPTGEERLPVEPLSEENEEGQHSSRRHYGD